MMAILLKGVKVRGRRRAGSDALRGGRGRKLQSDVTDLEKLTHAEKVLFFFHCYSVFF